MNQKKLLQAMEEECERLREYIHENDKRPNRIKRYFLNENEICSWCKKKMQKESLKFNAGVLYWCESCGHNAVKIKSCQCKNCVPNLKKEERTW